MEGANCRCPRQRLLPLGAAAPHDAGRTRAAESTRAGALAKVSVTTKAGAVIESHLAARVALAIPAWLTIILRMLFPAERIYCFFMLRCTKRGV